MQLHGILLYAAVLMTVLLPRIAAAQDSSSSSTPPKHTQKAATPSTLDPGTLTSGVYRNKTLALSCKIPPGWVLRTDEMNAREEDKTTPAPAQPPASAASSTGAKVLLAAFSRPPEVRAEDVNASILIAAESVAAYPGLKDAAQYFGPVSEVAKAQGFAVVEEPYQFVMGTKTVVRGDFQKDVGTRVMRQSTLVVLGHGYLVSLTFIGGTEDEVEELVQGLGFGAGAKTPAH